MEPCNELPECDIIITIKTGNKISTKEAYERIDFATNREIHMNLICEKLAEGDLGRITEKMYNAFSFTTPGIDKTIKKMMQQGSVGALMSGSGPAVFGLFNDHEKAVKACDFFTRNGYSAFLCKPLKKNMQNSKHIG